MMNLFNLAGNVAGLAAVLAVSSAFATDAADGQRWRADLSDQLWYEHQCRVVSVSQIKENGSRVEAAVRCSDKRLLRVRKSAGATFSVKDCGETANC